VIAIINKSALKLFFAYKYNWDSKLKFIQTLYPLSTDLLQKNIFLDLKVRVGLICRLCLINTNGNYVKLKNDI